jgi:hypothetical protein
LYFELAQVGARSVGRRRPWRYHPESNEALLAIAGEMLRHDPRLLTILLQWVIETWTELNPLEVRRQMTRMRWPQALAVVFSFVRVASQDAELRRFADYASAGWHRISPPERFFFGGERPGSRMAARHLGRNLAPYARWGFIATERPAADVFSKRTVGRYDAPTRRRILAELLDRQESVTLAEYLAAVDHSVTRQQAFSDLRSLGGLLLEGHGRGARWRRKKS